MVNTTQLLKNQLRQAMKARFAAITPEEYLSYNSVIEQRFFELPIVKNSNKIMIYYSINQEVETVSLINLLLTMGKTVALPACTPDKNLRTGIIHDMAELIPGIFGLSEPGPTTLEIKPCDLDLIVVPGVAFDKKGFRLGHGVGYYDRFLAVTNTFKLGLAYDFQLVDELPIDPHDIAIDAILTPSEYWDCKTNSYLVI
jgi:5-formyltetrahydrofolate cyclo-ligase